MYNKLFTKILDSSVWLESHATRIVWLTLLAAMDEDGMCQFASVANLARRAIVTTEEAGNAVKVLESPDVHSSDPENDGRRIERVPGGWVVLNAAKYRQQVSREESKRLQRERSQRYRDAHRNVTPMRDETLERHAENTHGNATVTGRNECVTQSEADADAEANTKEQILSGATLPHPEVPSGECASPKPAKLDPHLEIYEAYPRKEAPRLAHKAIGKAVQRIVTGEMGRPSKQKLEAQRWLYRRVLEYARSPAGSNPDRTKIPHPATWFNQSRYLDETAEWHNLSTTGGNTHGKPERIENTRASTQRVLTDLLGPANPMGRGTAGVGGTSEARPDPGRLYAEAAAALVAENPH